MEDTIALFSQTGLRARLLRRRDPKVIRGCCPGGVRASTLGTQEAVLCRLEWSVWYNFVDAGLQLRKRIRGREFLIGAGGVPKSISLHDDSLASISLNFQSQESKFVRCACAPE